MANASSGNTYYIDTQFSSNEELAVTGAVYSVSAIMVTATSASGRLVIGDGSTVKLDVRVPAANSTFTINLIDNPITFKTSLRPITLTNAVATIVFNRTSS